MPYFSVVVPTYNRAERLRGTLVSVLNQTCSDFEILVMDDGSTDHTREVVEGFADARIRYSWEGNSGGPATPRNRGIDAAGAEWVCFLDSDDIWHLTKLEEIKKTISNDSSVHVISHDEYIVFAGGGKKQRLAHGPYAHDFYRVMLIEGNRCSPSAIAIRKSFLDENGLRFNTAREYAIVEDYDFWLRLAQAGASFRFLKVVLGDCLVQADSISMNTEKYLHNLEVLLRHHVFALQTFATDKERLWRYVSIRLWVARAKQLIFNGKYAAAIRLALACVVRCPGGVLMYLIWKARRSIRKLTL